jgi:cyd operon protein YbgT
MWYFAWILGILMACFAGVLSALYILFFGLNFGESKNITGMCVVDKHL